MDTRTTIDRGVGGLFATTRFVLDERHVERHVTVDTRKDSNGALRTVATVATRDGMFLRHTRPVDFYYVLGAVPCPRLTEKVLRAAHTPHVAPEALEALAANVRAHYEVAS